MKACEVHRKACRLTTETPAHSGIYYYFGNIMKPLVQTPDKRLFHFQSNPRNPPMKKVSATPNSQWSSNKINASVRTTVPNSFPAVLPDIKQAFLPSSLDLTFTLSFRR